MEETVQWSSAVFRAGTQRNKCEKPEARGPCASSCAPRSIALGSVDEAVARAGSATDTGPPLARAWRLLDGFHRRHGAYLERDPRRPPWKRGRSGCRRAEERAGGAVARRQDDARGHPA